MTARACLKSERSRIKMQLHELSLTTCTRHHEHLHAKRLFLWVSKPDAISADSSPVVGKEIAEWQDKHEWQQWFGWFSTSWPEAEQGQAKEVTVRRMIWLWELAGRKGQPRKQKNNKEKEKKNERIFLFKKLIVCNFGLTESTIVTDRSCHASKRDTKMEKDRQVDRQTDRKGCNCSLYDAPHLCEKYLRTKHVHEANLVNEAMFRLGRRESSAAACQSRAKQLLRKFTTCSSSQKDTNTRTHNFCVLYWNLQKTFVHVSATYSCMTSIVLHVAPL